MSETRLASARDAAVRLYAALAAGDASALDQVLTEDFVGRAADGLVVAATGEQHGVDPMREQVWWQIGRNFVVSAEPAEFHLLDDGRLYVAGRYVGHARRSGRRLDAAFVHLITVRDGRISRLEQLTDTHLWTEALGDAGSLHRIDYEVVDGVAQVTLNRPDQRNAIDLLLAQETLTVARRIEADPAVRAVLISGTGPSLTVGGDIRYFLEHGGGDLGALFGTMITPFQEAFRILSRIQAPIVTAAHGAVAGGGLGFVYAADIVIAADDARFVTAFADLGVSGDGGGTWHLPRLIGPARAARVLLENRPIEAAEALDWGLVSELAPAEKLQARALEVAQRIAAGPTRAFGAMRRLLRDSWDRSLSEQLAAELEVMYPLGRTRDAQEAITAFVSKRPPLFEGR